jgi:hypothetical protein
MQIVFYPNNTQIKYFIHWVYHVLDLFSVTTYLAVKRVQNRKECDLIKPRARVMICNFIFEMLRICRCGWLVYLQI